MACTYVAFKSSETHHSGVHIYVKKHEQHGGVQSQKWLSDEPQRVARASHCKQYEQYTRADSITANIFPILHLVAATASTLNEDLLVQLAIFASPPLPHDVGSTRFWKIWACPPHSLPLKEFWSMGRTDTFRTSESVSTTKQQIEAERVSSVGCRIGMEDCVGLFSISTVLHAKAPSNRLNHALTTHLCIQLIF